MGIMIEFYKNSLKDMKDQLADKLNTLLEDNYSYIFEVVDINNDPHIIKYKENRITLLDVFKNQMKEERVDWHTLNKIANVLCVPCKSLELTFHNWEEFEDWKTKFHSGITQWDCKHEGYVFEDAAGYRVKFKSSFYKFWKQMRSLKERIQGGRTNAKIYKTKEEILNDEFDNFLLLNKEDVEEEIISTKKEIKDPFTILLLGVDSNGEGTDKWNGTRTDTIIVMNISQIFKFWAYFSS